MSDSTKQEQFEAFDRAHPDIYAQFKEIAETVREKRGHFSARAIIEIIRWERLTSNDAAHDDGFKINDRYLPYFARKLVQEDPSFDGFFAFRRLRAA